MKTAKVLLAVTLLVGFAASAQAASIVNSKHDLSTANASGSSIHAGATGTNQTCVFCHTPHNAVTPKLLWNRTNTPAGSTFSVYTSYNSAAMKTAVKANSWTLGADSTSLLCLSCHSLANSDDIFTNTKNHTEAANAATGVWATRTGGWDSAALSMTHPIGISYALAKAQAGAALNAAPATTPLFNTNGVGADSLECGSCHAVHDPTNKPFLRIDNAGSNLCTACHNK